MKQEAAIRSEPAGSDLMVALFLLLISRGFILRMYI